MSGPRRAFLRWLCDGAAADAPPMIGSAGTEQTSILDFARWAGWNAGQGQRGPNIVKPQTIKVMYTHQVKWRVLRTLNLARRRLANTRLVEFGQESARRRQRFEHHGRQEFSRRES
jgi:hypothetical protein